MSDTVVTLTSGTTWTVPSDFGTLVTVECIGAGGSANGGSTTTGNGGGGGAYSKITTIAGIAAGTVYSLQVGAGGGSGTAKDTWFDATNIVYAQGGQNAGSGSPTNAAGGLATSPTVGTAKAGGHGGKYSSFNPGPGIQNGGGGGGGAAGPSAVGHDGADAANGTGAAGGQGDGSAGGAAGATGSSGSNGGNGGNGTELGGGLGSGGGGGGGAPTKNGGNGGLYGAGAGGGGNGPSTHGTPGTAQGGLVIITYTPSTRRRWAMVF